MSDRSTHVLLTDGEVSDAHLVPCFEANRTPDTGSDEARTPVPSIFIRRFADVSLRCGLGACLPWVRVCDQLGCCDGRWEHDSQLIAACVEKLLRGYAPDAEGIVGIEDLSAVEIDLRCGVEAVEDEIDVGACQQNGGNIERILILPACIFDPLQFGFVITKEGVFDFFIGNQIEMHIARNFCGEPLSFRFMPRLDLHGTAKPGREPMRCSVRALFAVEPLQLLY